MFAEFAVTLADPTPEITGAWVSGGVRVVKVWSEDTVKFPEASLVLTRKWYKVEADKEDKATLWEVAKAVSKAVAWP
jgi:hypothetical protein